MELENIILNEVRLRSSKKIVCSPSYADYKPETNAVILSHTRGEHAQEDLGKGRKFKT
jgi:hypothetical protein